jgi:hypothetical protein
VSAGGRGPGIEQIELPGEGRRQDEVSALSLGKIPGVAEQMSEVTGFFFFYECGMAMHLPSLL